MKDIVLQFIPIFLIVLFLLYTTKMVQYSHTILGKIIALCIIIFYCTVDILYGVLACAIIIIFYQMTFEFNQFTENMDTYCNTMVHKNKNPNPINNGWKYAHDSVDSMNLGDSSYKNTCFTEENGKHTSVSKDFLESDAENKVVKENLGSQYDSESTTDIMKSQFQQNNCDSGILKYKNSIVKMEMTDHIFPQIKFKGNKCNPCDKMCQYEIDNKLMFEDEMLKPKNSNDHMSVWDNLMEMVNGKNKEPLHSVGILSEPFSFLR
jgi:hypothetical protein